MTDKEITAKYGLKNKWHGLALLCHLILIILGIIIASVQLVVNSELTLSTGINLIAAYLLLIGYASYGYKFPIISVQILIILIAIANQLGAIFSFATGAEGLHMILPCVINVVLFIAALLLKKSYKWSQFLLGLCFAADFVHFICRLIYEPGQSFWYYSMAFLFVILEAALMFINYSHRQREIIARQKQSEEAQ